MPINALTRRPFQFPILVSICQNVKKLLSSQQAEEN
jgi:hypothetical protein